MKRNKIATILSFTRDMNGNPVLYGDTWRKLASKEGYGDLAETVNAFLASVSLWQEPEWMNHAFKTIDRMGGGYFEQFERGLIRLPLDMSDFDIKDASLDAVAEMASYYGDRLSSTLWYGLAYAIATIDGADLSEEMRILFLNKAGTPSQVRLTMSALEKTSLLSTHLSAALSRYNRGLFHGAHGYAYPLDCLSYDFGDSKICFCRREEVARSYLETFCGEILLDLVRLGPPSTRKYEPVDSDAYAVMV